MSPMTNLKKKLKAKRIAIISALIVLLVAALCFLFGFAIANGWESVAKWFTSKWAVLTIIAVAFVVVALVFGYFHFKDKEDFK